LDTQDYQALSVERFGSFGVKSAALTPNPQIKASTGLATKASGFGVTKSASPVAGKITAMNEISCNEHT
jgi:hypothetical protein